MKTKLQVRNSASVQSATCHVEWLLAITAVVLLFPTTFATAQTSPATLPDLKLSKAATFMFDVAAQDNGKIIILGIFDSVNGVPATRIARLNPNGSVDLTFNFKPKGFGTTIVVPSGTNIYVGGDLGLIRLSALDGSTDTNWAPWATNLPVSAIAVSGNDIYIGGSFTNVGGVFRSNLARLSAAGSGEVDPNWKADANGSVRRIVVNADDVFVAGDFTNIGDKSRTNLAKLSASTGATDQDWDPKVRQGAFAPYTAVSDLAVSGTNVYVAGTFTNVGGVTRQGLAKLSTIGPGQVDTNWYPAGFAINSFNAAVGLINNALFAFNNGAIAKLDPNGVGAKDTNWNGSFDFPPLVFSVTPVGLFAAGGFELCSGEVSLSLAKLDLVTGARDNSFNAQVQQPGWVEAMAQQPDGKMVVGGDFWFAGGLPRRHLARVNQDGTLDSTWAPEIDGVVSSIAVSGMNAFVGGLFQKVGGLNRTNLAKLSLLGSDAVDTNWDARISSGFVHDLAVSGTNLFVGGEYLVLSGQTNGVALAKLGTTGSGDADPLWQTHLSFGGGFDNGGVYALALSGTNLYAGGYFDTVNGASRTNLVKLFTVGSERVDTNWSADVRASDPNNAAVSGLAVDGTNLFVSGSFTIIAGLPRGGLAKVGALDDGPVDSSWNVPGANSISVYAFISCLAVGDGGTNLYVGGAVNFGTNVDVRLARITTADGVVDPLFRPDMDNTPYALLASRNNLYVGGRFKTIAGATRYSLALLSVADAPQLIQDSPTNLIIARNEADGPEVTHFRITGVSGGTLYRSGAVTPVNLGDFLTIAEGGAGLKFVPGGTVTAVSALNNTSAGAGTASTVLRMVTNPSPVLKFSAAAYSVREGQGSIVVPVRKFGSGTATVNYATSDLTATGGQDYQTRSGTLNYSAIDRFQNLIITIADDLQLEGDERFAVTLTNASVGASIAGPATAIVTIVDNDIVGVSDSLRTPVSPASPPVSTGALAVSLQPTNANGQWRLVGELNWHDSSALVSGLVTGNYGIEFRPVNGYYPPAFSPVTQPINAGVTNQFTFFYAPTTNSGLGNLSVTIAPADVATTPDITQRGQWRRQGGPTNWLNSGDLDPDLNVGSYVVEFKSITNRVAPPPQIVQVGGNATYGVVGTYFFRASPGAETPAVVPFGPATTNAPYLYNGQIQTSVGFGSGFVVKPRVVLTAAHVLFDDVSLSYVTGARWFFQRYRDQLEPVPQVPRGWYVFEGYASQRQLDNSPGVSTPESQNFDAAAMYFLEDAGRGGYGGYLASDADANEYLLSANNKFLVGYPLDGVPDADKGKLHATTPANVTFVHLYSGVFATTNIGSFPGNSGGPLYVQADVDQYLPAAIYLGGSGQTLVRAINSEVVDLINRAEISGNGGGNSTGGGVIIISPGFTTPEAGTGLLTVSLTPSNATNIRPGWRIRGLTDTNFVTTAFTNLALLGGGGYPLEFKPVPGFLEPSNITVQVEVGQEVIVQAIYIPDPPTLGFSYSNGLTLNGATAAKYCIAYATNLTAPTTWTTLTTLTLSNASATISNTRPTAASRRFYRAELVP